jgi:parvulin-like peptidyl-prolyl isomerase
MNRPLFVLFLLLVPALLQAQSNSPASSRKADKLTELFGDPVIVKGKGIEITRNQLDEEIIRMKEMMLAANKPVPPEIDKQVLDALIGIKLLLSRATDADRAKAKEEFEKAIANMKKQQKWTDEQFNENLARSLKLKGQTREEWEKQQLEPQVTTIVIQRELNPALAEADAKKFYDEKKSLFEEPEMVRVGHILMSIRDPSDLNPNPLLRKELSPDQKEAKRKQIEDLLKRIRAGEDFAKLAKEYSEDPAIKQNDGEYKFARDSAFVEEFKAAAFALKTNEVSDVITTGFGYHLIKLLERYPARKEPYVGLDTKTIAPKADGEKYTIRDLLRDEALKKQLPDYMKRLKKEAGIEILDPKLKLDESATASSH